MDTSMERTESYVGVGGCDEEVWLGVHSPELLSNDRTSTFPVKVIQLIEPLFPRYGHPPPPQLGGV